MTPVVKKSIDSLWIGLVIGLFSPSLPLFIFYLIKYTHISFGDFFSKILMGYNILTPVISLCVITNLLVFFIFVWTNRNHSARGVLLATFMYAGYVVYQKYVA